MAVHIAATHKNEDYTPRYLMTEPVDSNGEQALHMFETCVSPAGVVLDSFLTFFGPQVYK